VQRAKHLMQPDMGPTASDDGLTGMQCRMARAGLRWTVDKLAQQAKVSRMSVNRIEGDVAKVNHATQEQIRRTLEKAGAEFIEADGVRIRKAPLP
jgi:DNA-binding XRE family transcriptional regulator